VNETTNHSIALLRRLQASQTFVCVYKISRFCTNPQKFQTLVPAKNSHLKGSETCTIHWRVEGQVVQHAHIYRKCCYTRKSHKPQTT